MGLKATVESMLMAAECMGVYASVALLSGDVLTEEAKDVANKVAPPRNFFECLLRDDWKPWLESIRREMKGWEENDAFEEIDFDDASLDHPVLELAELFMKMSAFSSNSHPSGAGWHKHPDTGSLGLEEKNNVMFCASEERYGEMHWMVL
jgi:hypothetical protein